MFGMNVKEIDAGELAKWVNTTEAGLRVIDVRQMEEIAQGTVPKAEALPLHTLPAKMHDLSKDEKLVMVCRSGARSAQACMFLQQQGFSNVYNLRGGMMGWMQSGFPAYRLA
ncbi:MAG: rhodanese-like domain-containing protein [Gammaproteobacteria bacterium]|nr:rhodanese-like domain-containing protein [Gammaproteobacteria bacterium]MBU1777007.1 rhodanese-like domain-containing protein [Gammaproteobacteria bacterium]